MLCEMKFALVDFYERQEVEIICTTDIVTECIRGTMNGEEWNPETDVKCYGKEEIAGGSWAKVLHFASDSAHLY